MTFDHMDSIGLKSGEEGVEGGFALGAVAAGDDDLSSEEAVL